MSGTGAQVCVRIGVLASVALVALMGCQPLEVAEVPAIPDAGERASPKEKESKRSVKMRRPNADSDQSAQSASSASPQHQADAFLAGQKAKGEEGRAGKALVPNAGVLAALRDDGANSGAMDGVALQDWGGVGGLVGAKGSQVGSGGLGSRGSGLGGGGGMGGLGGLGTKGIGSGASGYGRGSGVGARVGPMSGRYATAATPRQNTENYTNYGVNDVEIVESDRLSTFAVDVDTASYTISRSKLNSRVLPPTSAVRVEEFVNYFDYSYAAPKKDTFAVHLEAAPHPWVANHHLLRVGVKGAEPTIEEKPVRLTFLVDVSGSMNAPGKLELVKRSLHHLVDQSGLEDSIALATYAGATREVLQPTPITNKARIHKAIDSLSSSGGTAMEDGMTLAYGMARDGYLDGAENRVVVLSDGDANIGRSGFQGILRSIEQHAGKGITMSTIGFGRGNYKDTMMEQLANKGDGNYYYIDSFQEARKVFGTDLAGTTRTIARDVKVQVAFDPDAVLAYRLIGYENRDIADVDFRNDKVDAGEIGSGHEVTALYDVVLADDVSGGLGEVRLRHKAPGKDRAATERSVPIGSGVVRLEFGDASKDLRLATGAAMFAEVLRGSKYVEEMSLDQVIEVLRPIATTKREQELVGLVRQAQELGAGVSTPVASQASLLTGAAR